MERRVSKTHYLLTILSLFVPFLYALGFMLVYAVVSLGFPEPIMNNIILSCPVFQNGLVLFLSSPVNYFEVLFVSNVRVGLYLNFLLPALIIASVGMYITRNMKVLKKCFSIHSVFWLSVGATYLLSLVYWNFGKVLGAYNCPSLGTSILGVSLSAFMVASLILDLFSPKKSSIKRSVMYIAVILVYLFLVLFYFANGIIHLYGLGVFTGLLIIYLLATGKIKYNDIAKKISLGRVWILFLIALIIYIIYNTVFYNQIVFQITTTLMTISIIALTMYTSNKELHRASEKQTTTFKDSIEKLTTSVDRFYDFLENQRATRERAETQARTQAKPDIYIQPSIRKGWFLSDCLLNIVNEGGYATDIELVIGKQEKQMTISDLGRNMQLPILNCGRTLEFENIEEVKIKIYLKDGLLRRYFSDFSINFNKNERVHINLREIT